MEFRIADTFTGSLARLTGDEQKAVKTTAFDLQINPANPGMSFHKLDRAKDKNFWSVRVNNDIRLIVHKSSASLLLCYVDHHDKAYDWAERRKLETHPKTGAAQLIEIRETVKEIVLPSYTYSDIAVAPNHSTDDTLLYTSFTDDDLLGFGVPVEWINDVKNATSDTLLALADHLPAEAAEALLELATGGKPVPQLAPISVSPFDHPDAQRRFRVMTNVEELERALEFPWDKWAVFLHPDQRQWVERDYNGPARVSGSAGTGKTIVALHRAVHLARAYSHTRVLLTTFSDTLANALQLKLKRLLGNEPRLAERIDVYSLNAIGLRLYKTHVGPATIANYETVRGLLKEASSTTGAHKFGLHFLYSEWEHVVDALQLKSWDAYRDVARLGRKTRLPEGQREVLWSIFDHVRVALQSRELITYAELFTSLANAISKSEKVMFDFAVVDEAQDLSVAHLKFLAAVGGSRPNALFFAGDLGQRIFQQLFSWKALGVDLRGRSRTLRVNYRTSHQIRRQADRLLGPVVVDVDGNSESRSDAVSVFNGLTPTILNFKSESDESTSVGAWIADRIKEGVMPHECGVFVRSEAQLERARVAVESGGVAFKVLDEHVDTTSGVCLN